MAKKRMNGEGSWTKRDNGKWKLSISYKGIGRKYFYGTKKECLEKKNNFEAILNSNTVHEKDVLVKDFLNMWLEEIKKPTIKINSYKTFKTSSKIINNHIGDLSIQQLDSALIQTLLINKMKHDGSKYNTLRAVTSCLKQALEYAVVIGKITNNPMEHILMPKKTLFENKKTIVLSQDERERFITACYTLSKDTGEMIYENGPFFVFLLYTGLRAGEGLALKWSDVDFENRTIHITNTIVNFTENKKNSKHMQIDQPSTKTGVTRTVYLSDMAINALKDLQKHSNSVNSNYIVTNKYGNIVSYSNAYGIFNRIIKRAKIKQCGMHTLRHTFISMLMNDGVPATMVAQLVGHSNVNTTIRTYTHLLKETEEKSISIIKNLK